MSGGSRVNDDGSLRVSARCIVPAEEIEWRATTSGGPGGQHANRSLTRVVVTFRALDSRTLSSVEAQRIVDALGPVVRSSASRFRSQRQNRDAALQQLGDKLAMALAPRASRRATTPTTGAVRRRVDDKKARGRLKEQRRRPLDD